MEKVLFQEEQRFNQWWMWLIIGSTIACVAIPFGVGIYNQKVLNRPFGDNPMSTEGLIVTGLSLLLLLAFVFFIVMRLKLRTKITSEKLYVSFPPLVRKWKIIKPEEIASYAVRQYKPNWEYGGYGIKRRRKYGSAWIVSGRTGLQLQLINGKKFLIGTQKQQAIEYAMHKLMKEEE
ncbi:hypothetical protein [uncultured Draconibacterium sp.]|uniref:hypothetical protein n=1 Tax=uncultured Draconibacterium sp. TaxID=1573823 RepID=UPI0025D2594D|nr:hypothetical protein [uncultured Draconibacterium sp.]